MTDTQRGRRFDEPSEPTAFRAAFAAIARDPFTFSVGVILSVAIAMVAFVALGASAVGQATTTRLAAAGHVQVVMGASAARNATENLQRDLEGSPEVASVRLVARDDAVKTLPGGWSTVGGANPLPDLLDVELRPDRQGRGTALAAANGLRSRFASVAGVESIRFDPLLLQRLDRWSDAAARSVAQARLVAGLAGALLGLLLWLVVVRALAAPSRPANACIGLLGGVASGALIGVLGVSMNLWATGGLESGPLAFSAGRSVLQPGEIVIAVLVTLSVAIVGAALRDNSR